MENMNMSGGKCDCSHHKAIPVLIVLFGLLFLLEALNVVMADVVSVVWPILVIIGGLMKLFGSNCKCC